MSFREKTVWISLVSMVVIYGIYFASLFHKTPHTGGFRYGGLLWTVISLVVVQVVLICVVALFAPKEAQAPRDERDRLIDLRATRVAYAGLSTSVVMACFFGALDPPLIFNTDALLFLLVTAEVLRSACRIIQYRRGA